MASTTSRKRPSEVASLPLPQSMGYLLVGARIDPHDWGEPGGVPPAPAKVIAQRVIEQAKQGVGNIVLLHDGGGDRSHTIQALPDIIDGLRAEGFQLVLASDLIGQTRAQVMQPLTSARAGGGRRGYADLQLVRVAAAGNRLDLHHRHRSGERPGADRGRARADRKAAPGAAGAARIPPSGERADPGL